jgi:flagellar biosynthesis/type III secretory pathway protein FliH
MDVLKNVNMENVRFLEKDYSRPSENKFATWSVNELTSKSGSTEGGQGLRPNDTDSMRMASTASLPEGASALSKIDPELIESIKQEAYARGLAEGQQALAAFQDEAEKARAQAETAEFETTQALLSSIEKAILQLKEDPDLRHEPLKRLAMHLAEQLVLVELSVSPNSVQALIERCIETLDITASASVVVELNPNDMALLQTRTLDPGEEKKTWRLQADPTLLPGSVRVRAEDAVVTDLVEHRLESLAQSLLKDPQSWQAQTAFHPERLNARRGQANAVEDALPRESVSKDLADLDLPNLDLPDLNLPATPVADSNEEPDPSHE